MWRCLRCVWCVPSSLAAIRVYRHRRMCFYVDTIQPVCLVAGIMVCWYFIKMLNFPTHFLWIVFFFVLLYRLNVFAYIYRYSYTLFTTVAINITCIWAKDVCVCILSDVFWYSNAGKVVDAHNTRKYFNFSLYTESIIYDFWCRGLAGLFFLLNMLYASRMRNLFNYFQLAQHIAFLNNIFQLGWIQGSRPCFPLLYETQSIYPNNNGTNSSTQSYLWW